MFRRRVVAALLTLAVPARGSSLRLSRGESEPEPAPAHYVEEAPFDPALAEVMKHWVTGLIAVLREKKDTELLECCAKAKEWGVIPWSTYGQATPQQIEWWDKQNCDPIVGAGEPDMLVGLPKCEETRAFYTILPKPGAFVDLAEQEGEVSCTAEDRQKMNATYNKKIGKMTVPAQEYQMWASAADWGAADWWLRPECFPHMFKQQSESSREQLASCVKDLLQIDSTDCAKCYSHFALNAASTCGNECILISTEGSVDGVKVQSRKCMKCVQPLLQKHHRCIGGAIERPLTNEDVLVKLIGVGRR